MRGPEQLHPCGTKSKQYTPFCYGYGFFLSIVDFVCLIISYFK